MYNVQQRSTYPPRSVLLVLVRPLSLSFTCPTSGRRQEDIGKFLRRRDKQDNNDTFPALIRHCSRWATPLLSFTQVQHGNLESKNSA